MSVPYYLLYSMGIGHIPYSGRAHNQDTCSGRALNRVGQWAHTHVWYIIRYRAVGTYSGWAHAQVGHIIIINQVGQWAHTQEGNLIR